MEENLNRCVRDTRVTGSLCCTPETNNTANQLYFSLEENQAEQRGKGPFTRSALCYLNRGCHWDTRTGKERVPGCVSREGLSPSSGMRAPGPRPASSRVVCIPPTSPAVGRGSTLHPSAPRTPLIPLCHSRNATALILTDCYPDPRHSHPGLPEGQTGQTPPALLKRGQDSASSARGAHGTLRSPLAASLLISQRAQGGS